MQLTFAFLAGLMSTGAFALTVPNIEARGYPGLNDVQSRNAKAAIGEVRAEGLNRQACLAVISTALQESELQIYANPRVPASMNYPHDKVGGDQDSVGMFQQRAQFYPNIATDMSAAGSTRQFLAVMKGIRGWQTMEVSALDQAVQRAQAGNLYAKRIPLAKKVCSAAGF
ncbi:peptidase M23B [Cordyceps javanica]|uniref:Peptidase M23B n=1 Tax=Cordyceps javanica TaxID=43265 RepID=A0A545VSA7_9HYPO|nr:peptidase M23B [Cordyceps javanica]TQW04617.1 peptidase M23B [Cordyceps javanica]